MEATAPAPTLRLPERIAHLQASPEHPALPEQASLLVRGERDLFERSLRASPYRGANIPEEFSQITEMQAAARELHQERRSYLLRAPTSSGKSIAFAAPIFESGRPAVFVYPYRALLYDQAFTLLQVAHWFGYGPQDFGYLMGGVGRHELAQQLSGKRFILTTPDKLVSLFLAGREGKMAAMTLLSASDFVFDEIHAYSPMMIRSALYFLRSVRLWKERMGRTDASFVFASATIPEELRQELVQGLSLSADAELSGPSRTGDARVDFQAVRGSKDLDRHPYAEDMVQRGATTNAMVIVESPFAAYQICRSPVVRTSALLFIGQDKQAESQRREHLQRFAEETAHYALVGSNAIEAGVDLGARHLFMETGYADSTVQRFGRAARAGRDADVLIYDNFLVAAQQQGLLRAQYRRAEFTDLLRGIRPERTPARLMTGLAASPYMEFWGDEVAREIIEPEDYEFVRALRDQDVPALMSFRSLTPYTSYEGSGERIGFSSLFRKRLPMTGDQVSGSPSVERYFCAPERPAVHAKLLRIAHRETQWMEVHGTRLPVHYLLAEAHFGEFGKHWSVFQVGAQGDDFPDNMVLRYQNRTLAGVGTPLPVRFYG